MFHGSPCHCGQTCPMSPQQSRTDVGLFALTRTRRPARLRCPSLPAASTFPSGALKGQEWGLSLISMSDLSPTLGKLRVPPVKPGLSPVIGAWWLGVRAPWATKHVCPWSHVPEAGGRLAPVEQVEVERTGPREDRSPQ